MPEESDDASPLTEYALAAPVETPSNVGHQIVFIDGNVPDAQGLAQGVQPGIEVVILDPNSNGVQQIADYLTSHDEQNLDAIQIVSHGEDAAVRLGNTTLGLDNISLFSTELATIGQALKPGGDILFYGCNVGEGVAGAQFETEVSQATGGAHVAASSGLVGAASLGGSWNLDVADGTIDVGNPFTAATLAQFDNVLTTVTNQVWFSAVQELATLNVTGSTSTVSNGDILSGGSNAYGSIAVDAADGIYFITTNSNADGAPQQILKGNISGGTPTAIYTTPDTNGRDFLGQLSYSAANHKLYFSVADDLAPDGFGPDQGIPSDSGIYSINVNGTTTGSASLLVGYGGTSGLVNPYSMAIDTADNLIFFTDFGNSHNIAGSGPGQGRAYNPRIEVANLTTGVILNSNLAHIDGSVRANDFRFFYGLDVDPVSHTLYWTVSAAVDGGNGIASNNQILKASFTTGATPTLGTVTALFTATDFNRLVQSIAIDVANGVYYAGVGNGVTPLGTIVEGSLTSPGTPTTIFTLANQTTPEDVLFEAAPVLSVTGSPTTTPGGSAVDLTSSITLTDTLQNIAGATVTISAGHLTGDTLAATTTGTSISATYNATTGVLTLSGADSAAHYQQVLNSVTFATTATTAGSRTFTWSATDGHLASTTPTTTATVIVPPVVTAGASVTFNGGGSPVTLDSTLNVTNSSSTTLAGATIAITSNFLSGDTLIFSAQNGITGSYNTSTGVLTLSGTAILASYKTALESITYGFTANGDPTNAGSNTSRTISWTVNDGVASSSPATSTLTTVHTAPTVTASGSVSFTGGGNAVALDTGLTLADVDSGGKLASATVSISSGFQSGIDLLSVNGQSSGTIAGTNLTVSYNASTGVLTLTGSDTIAHYQAALDLVQYSVAANADPTNGGTHTSRTISWSVKDGSSSNGTSNTATSSLTTAHAAPVISVSGTPIYAAGGAGTVLNGTLTVSDTDSGGNLASATVAIASGFQSGTDVLSINGQTTGAISGTSITVAYNSSTGVLTLSGTDTLAHYQATLRLVTFNSTAGDPTSGGTDTSRTINLSVKDASTTNGSSNTGALTLSVTAGPSITAGTPSVTYFAAGTPATLDTGLTVSDVSATNLTGATVSITGNFVTGDTLAANVTGTSILASYNTATGVLTLSGSDTLAHYQQVLDAVTYSSTAADPTSAGGKLARTISWAASDSNSTGIAVTTTVSVRTPPVVNTASPVVTFTAGDSAVPLDSGLTLSDVETGTLSGAQVSITGGLQSGDVLNFSAQNGIGGVYSNGVLTLSGNASVSFYQAALRSITFSTNGTDITSGGADHTRTLTWSVSDNLNVGSDGATSTVTVIDPPVVTPSGVTPTYDAGGDGVILSSGLTLTDRESTQLTGVTVSIGGFQPGDTLTPTNPGGLSASYDTATGVLTLSGTSALANYQAVLESIVFSSSAADPTNGGTALTRTISWQVSDGAANSTTATTTVNVTAIDDPPVLTAGTTVGYTEQGTAAVLASTLTLSDANNTTLASATVSIGTGFLPGDTLNFTNQNGISGSYDSGTGVLTLTGSAAVANYQAALRSITFSSTSDNPTNFGVDASRTISWTANDGTADSTAAVSTVNVTAVDDAPVVTAGATVSFTEQGSAVVLDSGLTLSDPDNTTLAGATISIGGFVAGDTLDFVNQNGITGSYNSGTGVLSLTGSASVANYQAALQSITFSTTSDNPTDFGSDTSRTISWQVNDGTADSTAADSTVNITATNNAPVVIAGTTVGYTEQGTAVVLASTLTLSDVDNTTLAAATVSIGSGFLAGDTLNFTDQNGIGGSYDSGTGVLALTGSASVANYQTALRSITFSTTSDNPTDFGSDTSRTISWQVNDGTADSTAADSTVNITAVDDAPVVIAGTTVGFTEQGSAVVLASTLTLSDVDNTTLASATVSIGSGFLAGDTLNFTDQNGIGGSYDSGTGVLALTGSASVANYQTALRSITFSTTSDNPTDFGSDTSRTISWQVNDGTADSTAADSTVNITAVDDAPVVIAGTTVGFTEQGTAAVLASTLTLSDVDNTTLASATVSIGSGFLAGDTLNFTDQNGIGGSYDSGTGVLALTGSASVANYQTALRSITFSTTSDNPTDFGSDTSRTISWQVNDGTADSTAADSTVNVTAVDDAPLVTAGATVNNILLGSAVVLDSALTLADVDNTTLAGATVSIGSGFLPGDTLTFTDQNGISGSYDSSTGVLTLTGSASVANYQTALRSTTFSTSDATNASRTFNWTVSDGILASALASSFATLQQAPLTVSRGQTVSVASGIPRATTVQGGGTLLVLSGGLTSGAVLVGSGSTLVARETVSAGGAASATVLSNTGLLTVLSGGEADATIAGSDASIVILSGGTASGATLSNGAVENLSGGLAIGTQVKSGAAINAIGGIDSSAVVSNGGVANAIAGGIDIQNVLLRGGVEVISSGGTATGTVVSSGGLQTVSSGGAASGTQIHNQGVVQIYGIDTEATAAAGGVLDIWGLDRFANILAGGTATVLSGGRTSGSMILAGGLELVSSGGTASGATVVSGGQMSLLSGGTASGTIVSQGGRETVFAGGVTVGAQVSTDGLENVSSGGRASGIVLSSGGAATVWSGGTASATTVLSGGELVLLKGGAASGTTIGNGGVEVVSSGGGDRSATVGAGGQQLVSAGGAASGTVVVSDGVEIVSSAGVANGALLSHGSQTVLGHGTANATVISSGGVESIAGSATGTVVSAGGSAVVSSGGTASTLTIDSGGSALVQSGGAVSGVTLSGGTLEIASGGLVLASTITFSGGGTLTLDDAKFRGKIANFNSIDPDAIDFTTISAGTATLGYANNGLSGTLTVSDGTHTAKLAILGSYVAGNFHLATDGHGGTLLTDPPVSSGTNVVVPH